MGAKAEAPATRAARIRDLAYSFCDIKNGEKNVYGHEFCKKEMMELCIESAGAHHTAMRYSPTAGPRSQSCSVPGEGEPPLINNWRQLAKL